MSTFNFIPLNAQRLSERTVFRTILTTEDSYCAELNQQLLLCNENAVCFL
jgi:hypothetical protein